MDADSPSLLAISSRLRASLISFGRGGKRIDLSNTYRPLCVVCGLVLMAAPAIGCASSASQPGATGAEPQDLVSRTQAVSTQASAVPLGTMVHGGVSLGRTPSPMAPVVSMATVVGAMSPSDVTIVLHHQSGSIMPVSQ
jgi:hypothetical protein